MIEYAICISTMNRKEAFLKCYKQHLKHLPRNSTIIVVDDSSTEHYADANYRFPKRSGISLVKNKCLEIAISTTANHIFCFDDDIFPISNKWYLPYVLSEYEHLCYTFTHAYQNMPAKTGSWVENGHSFHTLGNGAMLYFTRECIDKVGGFRPEYGMASFEHVDLSNRIHRAGIIPHPFIDVLNSDKLVYSMDAHNEVQRSFTDQEKAELIQRNYPIFASKRFDTKFVPYK